MALSNAQIRSIGATAGKKVVQQACRERFDYVQQIMDDLREHQKDIILANAPDLTSQEAKDEMLFQTGSYINALEEFYTKAPLTDTVIANLESIKGAIERGNSVSDVAKAYESLITKVLDKGLDDFSQCQCEGVQASAKPLISEAEVGKWEERDRLVIDVHDKETGEVYASWADDDARQMFEDGFFKSGRQFEDSVLSYAEDMGIIAKS